MILMLDNSRKFDILVSMNYKLKILAKRGNRSNLRIVLLQRKPHIYILISHIFVCKISGAAIRGKI